MAEHRSGPRGRGKYSAAQVLTWLPCFKNGFLLFKIRDEDGLVPEAGLENGTLRKRIENVKVPGVAM